MHDCLSKFDERVPLNTFVIGEGIVFPTTDQRAITEEKLLNCARQVHAKTYIVTTGSRAIKYVEYMSFTDHPPLQSSSTIIANFPQHKLKNITLQD